MKVLAQVLLLSLSSYSLQAAEKLFNYQPSVMPEYAINGPFTVGVKTIDVTNPDALNLTTFTSKANRTLTLEVWYPSHDSNNNKAVYNSVTRLHKPFEVAGFAHRNAKSKVGSKYPLVVLSHGYTGYRTIMYYLGEHLASHGYIVIGIDHTDSTTAEIDLKVAPTAGFVSTLINRAKDQQFVLEIASSDDFFLSDVIDTDNASVIGYSMGGYGAVNTIGGCYDAKSENLMRLGFPKEAAESLLPLFNYCNAGLSQPDPRWKAMVGFAPWGQEWDIHQPEALAQIKVPTMYISGDQDDISGFTHGVEKLFKQTSKEDNFLLVYENARHNIAPHPAPAIAYETDEDLGHYYEPSWNTEQITRINEHMTLVFLDCYVKHQKDKCAYLPQRVDATQTKTSEGKLTKPWPGFKDRWLTGVKFYRAL